MPPSNPSKEAVKSFVLTNTQARQISIAGQDILPGHTSKPIPEDMRDAVERSPAFRAKWLVPGVVAMPTPKLPPLEKASLEQAARLISGESNVSVLQAWIESEKRPEVLALLSDRVKQL